jgi:hypothetical protein
MSTFRWLVSQVLKGGLAFILACLAMLFFAHIPNTGHVPSDELLMIVLGASFSVMALYWMGEPSIWGGLTWASRAAILIGVALILTFHGRMSLRECLEGAVLIALLAVIQYVAHRHALGWFFDENGERQKVQDRKGDTVIYTPTSRDARITTEIRLRAHRRMTLLWLTPITAGLVYLTLKFHHSGPRIDEVAAGAFAFLALLGWVPVAFLELIYFVGYQDMEGARVLDPEVRRPTIEDIEGQKAYGDAHVASEGEAVSALSSRRR